MAREPASDRIAEALVYLRTRQGGPSLEEQERQVAEAAESHALTVSNRIVEAAGIRAGDMVDRRTQLFELLAEVQSGRAGTILIGGADAIGENPTEAAIVAIMLERSGCRVVFADGFDPGPHRQQANKVIDGTFKDRL